jgi:hypothetical protein
MKRAQRAKKKKKKKKKEADDGDRTRDPQLEKLNPAVLAVSV